MGDKPNEDVREERKTEPEGDQGHETDQNEETATSSAAENPTSTSSTPIMSSSSGAAAIQATASTVQGQGQSMVSNTAQTPALPWTLPAHMQMHPAQSVYLPVTPAPAGGTMPLLPSPIIDQNLLVSLASQLVRSMVQVMPSPTPVIQNQNQNSHMFHTYNVNSPQLPQGQGGAGVTPQQNVQNIQPVQQTSLTGSGISIPDAPGMGTPPLATSSPRSSTDFHGIQKRLIEISEGRGNKSSSSSEPEIALNHDPVTLRPLSEIEKEKQDKAAKEGSPAQVDTERLAADLSDKLSAHRRIIAEQQELESHICDLLGIPDKSFLTQIQRDYSTKLPKARAVDASNWFRRAISNAGTTVKSELDSLGIELTTIQNLFGVSKKIQPIDPGWRPFASLLPQLILKVEHEALKADKFSRTTQRQLGSAPSTSGTASPGTSEFSVDGENVEERRLNMKMALNSVVAFEDKNPEEYFRYFTEATSKLPLANRKELLINRMGPQYFDRIKAIRSFPTWSDCLDHAMKEFSNTPDEVTAALALHGLEQGSLTIAKYNDKFINLLEQQGKDPYNIKDVILLSQYIKGMSNVSIKKNCMNKLADKHTRFEKTLAKFMEHAKEMENRDRHIHRRTGSMGFDAGEDDDEVLVAQTKTALARMPTATKPNSMTSPFQPDATCGLHVRASHTNRECKAPKYGSLIWCYCKDWIEMSTLLDGTHQQVCANRPAQCSICHNVGHEAIDCRKSSKDRNRDHTRRADRRDGSRSGSRSDRDHGRPYDKNRERYKKFYKTFKHHQKDGGFKKRRMEDKKKNRKEHKRQKAEALVAAAAEGDISSSTTDTSSESEFSDRE